MVEYKGRPRKDMKDIDTIKIPIFDADVDVPKCEVKPDIDISEKQHKQSWFEKIRVWFKIKFKF